MHTMEAIAKYTMRREARLPPFRCLCRRMYARQKMSANTYTTEIVSPEMKVEKSIIILKKERE